MWVVRLAEMANLRERELWNSVIQRKSHLLSDTS